jgi:hypothetical protein
MLRCTVNNFSREYLGGFISLLWMGGFLLGIVLIF